MQQGLLKNCTMPPEDVFKIEKVNNFKGYYTLTDIKHLPHVLLSLNGPILKKFVAF